MLRKRKKFGKGKVPPPMKQIMGITMVVFVLMIGFTIFIVNKGIKPTLMDVADSMITDFATRGINAAVKFAEDYDFEDVSDFTRDDNGDITSWKFDSGAINEINRYATDKVDEFFLRMNSGEVPEEEASDLKLDYGDTVEERRTEDPTLVEIPLGQVTGNTVLANLGPKVPVNLELIGNVQTDVVHETEDVGINGVLVKVYVHVESEVQIIIPFSTKVKEVSTDVYVTSGVVMGGVPDYYGGGEGNNPSISVPKEDLQKDE